MRLALEQALAAVLVDGGWHWRDELRMLVIDNVSPEVLARFADKRNSQRRARRRSEAPRLTNSTRLILSGATLAVGEVAFHLRRNGYAERMGTLGRWQLRLTAKGQDFFTKKYLQPKE